MIPQFGSNIYSEYANYGRTRKIIPRPSNTAKRQAGSRTPGK
jgi:hypothetical protein